MTAELETRSAVLELVLGVGDADPGAEFPDRKTDARVDRPHISVLPAFELPHLRSSNFIRVGQWCRDNATERRAI